MRKTLAFVILVSLSMASCKQEPKMYRYEKQIMGMKLSLKVPSKKGVDKCVDRVFKEVDDHYNNWNPQSEISRFNHYQGKASFPVSGSLWTLMKRVNDLVILTEGRFDPTVAPLVKAWKEALNNGRLLTPEERCKIHRICGWDSLVLHEHTLRKLKPDVQIDLCGVAKGYAVDRLAQELKQLGCAWAYVEWGGEIKTIGCHPQGREWQVSVEGIHVMNMENQAIATSGGMWQSWNIDGVCYTHIIDPKTGWPIILSENAPYTCAVKSKHCFEGDAIATALMSFSTVEEASEWAQNHLHEQTLFLINQKDWKQAHQR
jgi:FAD:protein FMN transferase